MYHSSFSENPFLKIPFSYILPTSLVIMAFILNILTGISFNFKVPIFLDTKDPTSCQDVSTNGITGRGRTTAPLSMTMSQWSQSYLQLGWKFQLCWNVTYWLILVTWEPLQGPLICVPEEEYADSPYPLEEEFLGSWKTLGMILLEARRPEGIPGSYLKELRWEFENCSS